jgi:hypothetical protein
MVHWEGGGRLTEPVGKMQSGRETEIERSRRLLLERFKRQTLIDTETPAGETM